MEKPSLDLYDHGIGGEIRIPVNRKPSRHQFSMNRLFILILAALSSSLVAAEKTNIVLILADDLGYSDLGCYGGEIKTPVLDALAEGGLKMTQLYNSARCCPTRASLMTGLYPHKAGVGFMTADNGKSGYRGFLNDHCVTTASLLRDNGYKTYLAGKWHLRGKGNLECTPTARGFDEFYGPFHDYASFYREDIYHRLPADRPKLKTKQPFYATDAITDYALHFLDDARKESSPYFLYLAYNAPHFPLQAPKELIDKYISNYEKGWDQIRVERFNKMLKLGLIPEDLKLSPRGLVPEVPNRNRGSAYFGKTIPLWDGLSSDRKADLTRRMATYAAMVEIVDQNIGRVVDDLKKNGEFDRTCIFFLSDNGACAEWDPHGFDNNPYPNNKLYRDSELDLMGQKDTFHSYGTGWANACNTPFNSYKHYTYEGGISSPAIIHFPDQLKGQGTIQRQSAHVMDVAATILDIAGANYPKNRSGKEINPLQGRSLLPMIQGNAMEGRTLYFEHEGNRAVRDKKWKIVYSNYTQKWELYDIIKDRSETNDLASNHPEIVSELAEKWDKWAAENFVLPSKIKLKAKGMPTIYYMKETPPPAK